MTFIKICGITRLDDALAAIDLGTDALGFVFIANSPRYVGNNPDLPTILSRLPPTVARVAICPSATIPFPSQGEFDAVQYYDLDASIPAGIYTIGGYRMHPAFAARTNLNALLCDAILLDAYHPERLGGLGKTCDWQWARQIREHSDKPIILAGGLTPENAAEAISIVRPAGVDVSSGVEASPGRKDLSKMRAFISAVRNANVRSITSSDRSLIT